MTAAEVVSIVKTKKIDKNVFNFFDKYKPYELLLVQEKKPLVEGSNDLLDRDDLIEFIKDPTKPQYKKHELLKYYDEVKWRMDWYDCSNIYSSSTQVFDCERYDFNNIQAVSENVYSLIDRTTGELVYVAADQTNAIIRYAYDQKCDVLDYKTGEVNEEDINQGKDRLGTDKHRNAIWYRD